MQQNYFTANVKYWLCFLLMLLTFPCYSEPKQLKIAVPEDGYAPFIIINNEQITGILIEPLQLAAANIGIELTYVYAPEKRSQLMLDIHDVDARMESKVWVSEPENYWWSEPITVLDDIFVYHKQSKTDFETEQALAGAELVVHLGYVYPTLQPLIDANVIHRADFSSEFAMLQSLSRATPDIKRVAVMNKDVALWLINSTPKFQNTFLFSKYVVASAPLQFQFAKRPELKNLIDNLNKELVQLKQTGTIEKISAKTLSFISKE
ncbi:hypothetical protein tinsulaeT_25580 [Thalassotalea insulae]|uniref:Solute-binding protein family 3/N-terminal domain-containing protein n=1 Tax=Thalassotalea insulae TaxID=2056778 RepID=A0ABQ6GTF1_9GAMM|nr:transporter substrate-binding domain-containing protein [Thalassotalea insulae]GLX79218.1 hypothetical protein tinsulaeT_25580 [Thalassotalea insulae]